MASRAFGAGPKKPLRRPKNTQLTQVESTVPTDKASVEYRRKKTERKMERRNRDQ